MNLPNSGVAKKKLVAVNGHLLGKDSPLDSFLRCLIVFCHFPMWYPGSGVVLDCMVF